MSTRDRQTFRNLNDIEAFERIPLEQRIDAWTVHDLLTRGASFNADKPALMYFPTAELDEIPTTVTYRDLLRRVNQAANLFAALYPRDPPTVALMAPNVPDTVVCLYAAPTAGSLCPLNWKANPTANSKILRDVGAKILVTLGPTPGFDIWEKALELLDHAPGIEHVLQIAGPGGTTDPLKDLARLAAAQPDELAFERRDDRHRIAILSSTGGTTGDPKVVKITHGGIAFACFAYSWCLEHGPEDTMLMGIPLFHSGGIIPRTMNPLAQGVTNVLLSPLGFRNKGVLEHFWEHVARCGVTELNLVPTLIARLSGTAPPKNALRKLRRYGTSGSATLLPGVARKFEELTGIRMLSLYGLTEYSVVTIPPVRGEARPGASGMRVPYTQIKIVELDDKGAWMRDCPAGETGSIAIKGPGAAPGYVSDEASSRLYLGDGWMNTGDRGYLDDDGYLWVTGRTKDLIIRNGVNIDAVLIEDMVLAHPAVALAAAVAKPDPVAGEVPVLFVQLKKGVNARPAEIHEFACNRIVERIAQPTEVHVLDSIPLTDVGKIAKAPLRLEAARRAFEEALVPLARAGISVAIGVADSPGHGIVPTVSLRACPDRPVAERAIRDILDRYARQVVIAPE